MIGNGQVWGTVAILALAVSFAAAPLLARQLHRGGASAWIIAAVALFGGPLAVVIFYALRLPGYHGVCVGMFGDTTPCNFQAFASDEARKMFFGLPLAIGWSAIFLVVSLVARFPGRLQRFPKRDRA